MKTLDLIRVIESERREARKAPFHVLYLNLLDRSGKTREELNKELASLLKHGKIKIIETINDRAIKTL